MMHKMLSTIILSIGLLFAQSSMAALNIEITKGARAPIPLAVIPFVDHKASAGDEDNALITSVIYNDLQNSGYFKVIPFDQLKQFPHTAAAVNQAYWRGIGVDNVLVGQIQNQDNDHVHVVVSLVNVFHSNPQDSGVLFTQTFDVAKSHLRQLAHQISDQIYRELTGEQGVFSTQVAYVLVKRIPNNPAHYSLQVADFDGYNATTLLGSDQPIMSPAWSPNGKKLAYVSFENKKSQLYIQDIQSGQRTLVSDYDGINGAPAWSPDGKKLALVLSKTGHPKIYTLDLQTKQLNQVTQGWSIDTEPVWARDAQSLYFTSDRGGAPQIYQVNLNTGEITRVTFEGNFNARASISNDGNTMALLHRDGSGFNVAVYNVKSGQMLPLTNTGHNQSPTLAPNGHLVMYATYFAGQSVLAIVSTDGSVSLRLPAKEGDVQEPAWSPLLLTL